jgi:hypothetical protein
MQTNRFDEYLRKYGVYTESTEVLDPTQLKLIGDKLAVESVKVSGRLIGVNVIENFVRILSKEWYKYYYRRDSMVIKFFCNIGFFRDQTERCIHSEGNSSRRHAINDCSYYTEHRTQVEKKLEPIRRDK